MMNDSEVLFPFWQNVSDYDNQTGREFPHWRPVVVLELLSLWLLAVSMTIPLSFSVLVAVMVSSLNKKLGMVHVYVLVVNIFVRFSMTLSLSSFLPPAIRFCDCSITISSISFYLHLFNICYQLYTLVSLAVFQLLIIKGKKKFVNYKAVGVTLFTITIVTVVVPIIFIGIATEGDGGSALCYSTVGCAGIDAARLLAVFTSFHITVWVPSFSILVTVTVWSCTIFKKNYAGRDNGLNRRIVAMPLVMPVIVSLISIVTVALYRIVDIITLQTLSSNAFSRNWNVSFGATVVILNEIASGLSYPCLILFLNPKLWVSWKKLTLFWKKNQVTPEQSNNKPSTSLECAI